MARGGRRKVWICDQRDRANQKWVKSVCKAVTPSKRTQRAFVKAMLSSSSARKKQSYEQPIVNQKCRSEPVTWENVKPSNKQLAGCIAVGAVCTYPVFASGAFDGSAAGFALLPFFFGIPFLVSLLVILNYNKTEYRVSLDKEKRVETVENEDEAVQEVIRDAQNEIDKQNASIFMGQFKDSLSIMQKTADPSTFFSRFDFVLERLDDMIELKEKGFSFAGDLYGMREQAKDEDNFADTVNCLIDNSYKEQLQKLSTLKTERGKANSNQKWYASFEPFFDRMPMRSRTYLDLKLEELKEV
jgi:hypothetical protein